MALTRNVNCRFSHPERVVLDLACDTTGRSLADIVRDGTIGEIGRIMRDHHCWPLAGITDGTAKRTIIKSFLRWSFVVTSEDPGAYLEVDADDPDRYDFRQNVVNSADLEEHVREYEELFIGR